MNTKEKKEFNHQFWSFLWASILIGLSACLGNVVDAMISVDGNAKSTHD